MGNLKVMVEFAEGDFGCPMFIRRIIEERLWLPYVSQKNDRSNYDDNDFLPETITLIFNKLDKND